ncbi:MAG: hypothetical protein ACE5HX_09355, partial [bacterium]
CQYLKPKVCTALTLKLAIHNTSERFIVVITNDKIQAIIWEYDGTLVDTRLKNLSQMDYYSVWKNLLN